MAASPSAKPTPTPGRQRDSGSGSLGFHAYRVEAVSNGTGLSEGGSGSVAETSTGSPGASASCVGCASVGQTSVGSMLAAASIARVQEKEARTRSSGEASIITRDYIQDWERAHTALPEGSADRAA